MLAERESPSLKWRGEGPGLPGRAGHPWKGPPKRVTRSERVLKHPRQARLTRPCQAPVNGASRSAQCARRELEALSQGETGRGGAGGGQLAPARRYGGRPAFGPTQLGTAEDLTSKQPVAVALCPYRRPQRYRWVEDGETKSYRPALRGLVCLCVPRGGANAGQTTTSAASGANWQISSLEVPARRSATGIAWVCEKHELCAAARGTICSSGALPRQNTRFIHGNAQAATRKGQASGLGSSKEPQT